jgi:hypothetical protein
MRVYSYVVAQDYGFAPNPFFGRCTLATCKPPIRERAAIGDFIIGTGAAQHDRSGHLVFFMRVDEITTYDGYWNDPRFLRKRPYLHGSKMQAFGDNIYHKHPRTGRWVQADSYHSLPGGHPNPLNVNHDTKSGRVLIATQFTYWGGEGPSIPARFTRGSNASLFRGRAYRIIPERIATPLIQWIRELNQSGCIGQPLDWRRSG